MKHRLVDIIWIKNILKFLFLFLLSKIYIEIYLLKAISKYI